jgi:hypothetical protein
MRGVAMFRNHIKMTKGEYKGEWPIWEIKVFVLECRLLGNEVWVDCAIAQAASHRLFTGEARFQSRGSPRVIYGGQSGTWALILQSPPPFISWPRLMGQTRSKWLGIRVNDGLL